MINKAHKFAKKKHKGQVDDCGKDYFIEHCFQVYQLLTAVTEDVKILVAGLLHDTLEDTDTTYEELKKEFGQRVADLVNEVTKEKKNDKSCFPRLKSEEAILIKFADRLSNLSRMDCWDKKKKDWYFKKSKFWKTEV